MKTLKSIALIVLISIVACSPDNEKYGKLENGLYADIQTDKGDVLVELAYKDVPKTVGNFVSLAEGSNFRVTDSMLGKPFYDGLKFHRVISFANGDNGDFMIQGGCPLGNGLGDPGYRFSDEFVKDEDGNLKFSHSKAGVISMANGGPNTNGSQFFITIAGASHLDGKHTIFGNVKKGFEIAKDSIVENTVINTIDIIRVGSDAKKFNAYKVFDNAMSEEQKSVLEQKKKVEQLTQTFLTKMEEYKAKAKTFPSGLQMYILKEGEGIKPGVGADIRIGYSAFFTDGKILDTNRKELAIEYGIYTNSREAQGGYEPFAAKYSMDGQMIQGFKEGMMQMRLGDRAVLFIPYHLAWGEEASRRIPAKSDVIFEVELFPKEEK